MIFFLVVGIVLIMSGMAISKNSKRYDSLLEKIQRIPTSLISSVQTEGVLTEVKGIVKPIEIVREPINNREVVYNNIKLYKMVSSGKSRYKKLMSNEVNGKEFYIKDASGYARINPALAVCYFEKRIFHFDNGGNFFNNNFPVSIANYIKSKGFELTTMLGFYYNFIFDQIIILPNDPLYVLGYPELKEDQSIEARSDNYRSVSYNIPYFSSQRGELVLSDLSEEELLNKFSSRRKNSVLSGILFCFFGVALIWWSLWLTLISFLPMLLK